MENYIITDWEKEIYLEKTPTLACPNSIGIDYDDYISVKCKLFMGTCTYAKSNKNEYLNCKFLQK